MSSQYHYTLIRSRRRSIALQIGNNGVLIVKAPLLMPTFMIDRFIAEKRSWIEKQQKLITKFRTQKNGVISEGDEYSFLGTIYTIHAGSYASVHIHKTLNIPTVSMFRAKQELTRWYITQAKTIITKRLRYFSTVMDASYISVTFSDTTSKWGSCSHDNKLQFNWRLVMAPLTIIDYVVIHELAHTKEKNHGPNFWKIVSTHKPAYRQYIKWLKINSHKLHSVLK